MLLLNLIIRKTLWGALACFSLYFVHHFYSYGRQLVNLAKEDIFLLFFVESWLYIWLIVLFLSIIMMLGRYFDGIDDYVEVPDSPSLNVTSFTIIAWIYLNKFTGAVVVKGRRAFDIIGYESYLLGFRDWIPDWGLRLDWTDGTIGWLTQAGVLELNKWHFIAGSYDGNTARLYYNEQLITSYTFNKTLTTVAYPLYISEPTMGLLNGQLSLLGIFNRALDLDEIKYIYEETQTRIMRRIDALNIKMR